MSQLDDARRALHLDVPCPVCGAEYGKPCRTPSGGVYRREVHFVRTLPPTGWVQPDLFSLDEAE
jgi:hypothetical protein